MKNLENTPFKGEQQPQNNFSLEAIWDDLKKYRKGEGRNILNLAKNTIFTNQNKGTGAFPEYEEAHYPDRWSESEISKDIERYNLPTKTHGEVTGLIFQNQDSDMKRSPVEKPERSGGSLTVSIKDRGASPEKDGKIDHPVAPESLPMESNEAMENDIEEVAKRAKEIFENKSYVILVEKTARGLVSGRYRGGSKDVSVSPVMDAGDLRGQKAIYPLGIDSKEGLDSVELFKAQPFILSQPEGNPLLGIAYACKDDNDAKSVFDMRSGRDGYGALYVGIPAGDPMFEYVKSHPSVMVELLKTHLPDWDRTKDLYSRSDLMLKNETFIDISSFVYKWEEKKADWLAHKNNTSGSQK